MRSNFIITLFVLFVITGCGESEEESAIQFAKIRAELIGNYENKKSLFNDIKSYFKLNHIKHIQFSEDKIAAIHYKLGHARDTGEWEKLENKEITSQDIKQILDLDSLRTGDLHQLRKDLEKIGVYSISLIDYYDATRGKFSKELDLKYKKEMNGLRFYYRIFQESLDSMENSSYSLLIQNNEKGGILGDNIVWYYN